MLRGWEKDAGNNNPFDDDDDESSPSGEGTGNVVLSPMDASVTDTPVGVAYESPPPSAAASAAAAAPRRGSHHAVPQPRAAGPAAQPVSRVGRGEPAVRS